MSCIDKFTEIKNKINELDSAVMEACLLYTSYIIYSKSNLLEIYIVPNTDTSCFNSWYVSTYIYNCITISIKIYTICTSNCNKLLY